MKFSICILAGGKNSRMGKDKSLLKYRGKTFIEHVIKKSNSYSNYIFISSNNEAHKNLGLPVINDNVQNIGPISGITTGLNHSKYEHTLFLTCDSPLICLSIFEKYTSIANNHFQVHFPYFEDNIYPLTAMYSKSVLPELNKMIANKDYKVRNLFNLVSSQKIKLSKEENNSLKNINTPQDYIDLLSNE